MGRRIAKKLRGKDSFDGSVQEIAEEEIDEEEYAIFLHEKEMENEEANAKRLMSTEILRRLNKADSEEQVRAIHLKTFEQAKRCYTPISSSSSGGLLGSAKRTMSPQKSSTPINNDQQKAILSSSVEHIIPLEVIRPGTTFQKDCGDPSVGGESHEDKVDPILSTGAAKLSAKIQHFSKTFDGAVIKTGLDAGYTIQDVISALRGLQAMGKSISSSKLMMVALQQRAPLMMNAYVSERRMKLKAFPNLCLKKPRKKVGPLPPIIKVQSRDDRPDTTATDDTVPYHEGNNATQFPYSSSSSFRPQHSSHTVRSSDVRPGSALSTPPTSDPIATCTISTASSTTRNRPPSDGRTAATSLHLISCTATSHKQTANSAHVPTSPSFSSNSKRRTPTQSDSVSQKCHGPLTRTEQHVALQVKNNLERTLLSPLTLDGPISDILFQALFKICSIKCAGYLLTEDDGAGSHNFDLFVMVLCKVPPHHTSKKKAIVRERARYAAMLANKYLTKMQSAEIHTIRELVTNLNI